MNSTELALGQAYFWLCAALAVGGALATVLAKNPIRGAMGLLMMILGDRGHLPRAPRAVPRGDPAHRLRRRDRRPLHLRHHAARSGRDPAARRARAGLADRRRGGCSAPPGSRRCRSSSAPRRRSRRARSSRRRPTTSGASRRSGASSSPTPSCRSSSRARCSWSPSSAPSPSRAATTSRTPTPPAATPDGADAGSQPPQRSGSRGAEARAGGIHVIPVEYYVALSAVLFTIGGIGFLVRRNVIATLMSIEIMLNAVNLAFVAFNRSRTDSSHRPDLRLLPHRRGGRRGRRRSRHRAVALPHPTHRPLGRSRPLEELETNAR